MPVSHTNTAVPPRKAKTPQGPKRRNIVDVEKLKTDNQTGQPGVEKENVKFLFSLLEQASNERELLIKQLAEKSEIIEVISQQRDFEESSFRKVLSTERKKFDKKILDARCMLERREELLRQWSNVGAALLSSSTANSDEYQKTVSLLKKTCKIVPDAMEASQMEQLKIWNDSADVEERDEEDEGEGEVEMNEDEDDFYDEEFAAEQGQNVHSLDENSIGGHSMSGSILLNESQTTGKSKSKMAVDNSKVEKQLNMGASGVLEDKSSYGEFENISLHASTSKSISISELAAKEGSSQVFIRQNDNLDSTSQQYPSLSILSDGDTSKIKDDRSKSTPVSSSSNVQNSGKSSTKESRKAKKKKGKTMESASLDLSNSSTKKYWWDHLVDGSSDDKVGKGKDDSVVNELVLGSRLDKCGKSSKLSDDEDNDDDDGGGDGINKNTQAAKKSEQTEDEGSVMSLHSEDFNFSTTTSGI